MSPWVHRIMVAIFAVLFLALAASSWPALSEIAGNWRPYLAAVGVTFGAWCLGLVAHELGHVLAGWLVGLRFVHVETGPIGIRRWTRGSRFYRTGRHSLSGEAAMRTTTLNSLRSRMIWFTLGGMIANAVTFLVAVSMFLDSTTGEHRGPWPARLFWLTLAVVSVYFISVSAEANPGRHVTDAKMIRDIWKRTPEGADDLIAHGLWAVRHAEPARRPGMFRELFGVYGSEASRSGLLNLLDSALDLADAEMKDRCIESLLAKDSDPEVRAAIAFQGAVRARDLVLVEKYLPKAEEMTDERMLIRQRTVTLLALLEGRYDEARDLARSVLEIAGLREESRQWFEMAAKSADPSRHWDQVG